MPHGHSVDQDGMASPTGVSSRLAGGMRLLDNIRNKNIDAENKSGVKRVARRCPLVNKLMEGAIISAQADAAVED